MRGAVIIFAILGASVARADAFGRPQSLVPIGQGGTGQTSSNYATQFPPGLATLFVFSARQMHDESLVADTPQFIPAAISSGSAPTMLVGTTAGTTNPTLIARRWMAATLSTAGVGNGVTDQCPQFSQNADPGATAISATGKFEFMLLTREQNEPTNGDVVMNTSLTSDTAGFRLRNSGTNGNYIWATSNGSATVNTLTLGAGATRAIRRKWHVVDVNGDGTNQTMNLYTLGGVVAATVGPTANGNSPAGNPGQPVTIGANYLCQNHQDTQIGAIAIWPRALSSAERALAVPALFRAAELDPNVDLKVVLIVGDSILAGKTPTVTPTPWQLLDGYLPGYRVTQRAVSGTTTSQIATTLTDELTVETPAVVIVEGGVNDISAATADATISTNLLAMCTAAKAAGAKCILMNITPGDTGNQVVHTPIVNATSAGYTIPTQIDALFDANALLAAPPGTTQTTWNDTYDSDALHPNTLGVRVIAKGLADKITALTGP